MKITHYPVIHCRKGSLGYKLEWNGLSMLYSSDTKPEWNSVTQARNGDKPMDVFIHEMIVPPEVWAMKMLGLSLIPTGNDGFDKAVANLKRVQNSSHTPQGAFGYLLSQIDPLPRLTVATHFPVADDTVDCALKSVQAHVPTIGNLGEKIVWSFDGMVIRVFAGDPKPAIKQQVVSPISDFSFAPISYTPEDQLTPKYHDANNDGDSYAQIDIPTSIVKPIDQKDGDKPNWCDTGY